MQRCWQLYLLLDWFQFLLILLGNKIICKIELGRFLCVLLMLVYVFERLLSRVSSTHTHTHTHTYTHTHTHTHTRIRMNTYTHMHARTHARTHAHTHMNIYEYIYIYIHIYIYMYIYIYILNQDIFVPFRQTTFVWNLMRDETNFALGIHLPCSVHRIYTV